MKDFNKAIEMITLIDPHFEVTVEWNGKQMYMLNDEQVQVRIYMCRSGLCFDFEGRLEGELESHAAHCFSDEEHVREATILIRKMKDIF